MNPKEPIAFAVDDDASMREALARLFRSIGMRAQIFASAQDFFRIDAPGRAGMPRSRRAVARIERSRSPTRTDCGGLYDSNHLYYRPWRHPDAPREVVPSNQKGLEEAEANERKLE